jgi:hypothetical protein
LNILLSGLQDKSAIDSQKGNRDYEISFSFLKKKLNENQRYNQLKFSSAELSIDSIQRKLSSERSALLSFYFLRDSLVTFYITEEEFGYRSISLHDSLRDKILLLRKDLSGEEFLQEQARQDIVHFLTHDLISPVYEKIRNHAV